MFLLCFFLHDMVFKIQNKNVFLFVFILRILPPTCLIIWKIQLTSSYDSSSFGNVCIVPFSLWVEQKLFCALGKFYFKVYNCSGMTNKYVIKRVSFSLRQMNVEFCLMKADNKLHLYFENISRRISRSFTKIKNS